MSENTYGPQSFGTSESQDPRKGAHDRHRAITAFIRKKAKRKGFRSKLQPGAVTLIQRFGGSLNLNVHYHMLFLEGGYYETHQGPKYWWIDPPTDAEIQAMVTTLASRVIRLLKKRGYFQDEEESAIAEEEMTQQELLPELQAASVQSRIALGERRGQRVRRLGSLEWTDGQKPELKGTLCAVVSGFSLHAAIYCAPWERGKLEKLCRYIARPAVAEERLSLQPSGDIVLKLKTKYSDGTSHTRFHGCLAPHAKMRSQIVPKPNEEPDPQATGRDTSQDPEGEPKKSRRMGWAELLARVFAIDLQHCPNCGGENFKPLAAIIEVCAIRKILPHLGLPDKPPDIAPARLSPQMS